MQFRLFSMFLLMTAAAVVAYVFTRDTSDGVFSLAILLTLIVSASGRKWFMNLNKKGVLKLFVLSALGGVAAWWCLLLAMLAISDRPLAEVLFDQSLYYFHLMSTLGTAAFGMFLGIMAWAMARIEWKQPNPRQVCIIAGLVGSLLLTVVVSNLLELSFAKPVSQLSWYDDYVIVVIALSLSAGAFLGFKICAVGQRLLNSTFDTEYHSSSDVI